MGERKIRVISTIILFMLAFGVNSSIAEIDWQQIGEGTFNTVLVHPDNPQIIYAGTDRAIIKTINRGEDWKRVFSARGKNKAINLILFNPQDKNQLYAATSAGLFYSSNVGINWVRIFKGKGYLENDCTALAILSSGIYLGTKSGLFISKDNGRSWFRQWSELGNSHILAIAYSLKQANFVYIACKDIVFKSENNGQSWQRCFTVLSAENGDDLEEEEEERDEKENSSVIRYISIDPENTNNLYLATSRGIYKSENRAQDWERLLSYGLLSRDIRFVLISASRKIFAVTNSGIFEYKEQRWQELSLRILADYMNFLASDNNGNLYAATDRGLFKRKNLTFESKADDSLISLYCKGEPSISEIQKAAIRYAEVEPEKIINWRKQAAKKALLPEVSLGVERNITDLWHWEGGSTTREGDDILRRGNDAIEWDISLSWDLGELIWNDDQTSIDVRSKLMVQLRDDILDEVTRLYFERLRLKLEMDNLSITEGRKRLEKEIKIEELTALIDALTGGYLSRHIKSKIGS